jgi:lysine 2,3-aminomutase
MILVTISSTTLSSSRKKSKKLSLRTPEDLIQAGLAASQDLAHLTQIQENFTLAITPAVQETFLDPKNLDPVALQYLPQKEELNIQPYELTDPIGDDTHSPIPGIVHRYPDRCLIKISNVCPVYCRFCFRKEHIGPGSKALERDDRKAAYHYIETHPEIWEVILTGGDPLVLNPKLLAETIQALSQIPHLKIIRIHTRVPLTDPERISQNLLGALETPKMLIIAIHANHSQEFSPTAQAALKKIRLAGIPMVSQTVLLKNINDNAETLGQLMRTFMENGVKPYYLHHLDPARGTSHFQVPIERGQEIMEQLRGRFSGLCQPTYVIDIPHGFGKSPIGPNYLNAEKTEIKDFKGETHSLF